MKTEAEKRKASRFGCTVPVECKKGLAFDKSQTLDISKGGLGFISTERIPINTKMAIEIALTPEADPILAFGQVKWVKQLAHKNFYRIGMMFSDISRSWQLRLDRYIQRLV